MCEVELPRQHATERCVRGRLGEENRKAVVCGVVQLFGACAENIRPFSLPFSCFVVQPNRMNVRRESSHFIKTTKKEGQKLLTTRLVVASSSVEGGEGCF